MHDAVNGWQGRWDCACGRVCPTGCEQTLLYQLVEAHYPAFVAHLAARERTLPAHVQREFEDYLKCGRLEHGFLRVRGADCHAERLVAFSWPLLRIPAPAALVIRSRHKRRGFCPSCGVR